ncbi:MULTISPECIES: OmpA family protein [unclassified Pseudomonas]|uniref:OmpA family protein n=1 Tax=unclassified Pseudomonas TaxID=196821 RepID=UPI002E81E335|nr:MULTISPECIES: OmpA family protein [unclassified Pseudomonas]
MNSRAGNNKDREIIIKRRSRKGHEEAHGGAWKVAFADFTMAMMALFMVLWIVQPQNHMENPAAGDLEANPLVDGGAGVFDGTSKTPVELDGMPMPAKPEVHLQGTGQAGRAKTASAEQALRHYQSTADLQELAALIREVSGKVDALANIEVNVVPQGLRILIKDDQNRFMFERGSATLNPHFKGLLVALSGVLAKVDNKLILSGHTDAVQYRQRNGYDNWNLSGDRALRARNVLVEGGMPGSNVLQVAAQADVMPLRSDDPKDGTNRRIEVLLLTDSAENLYRQLFGESYARVKFSQQGAEFEGGQP